MVIATDRRRRAQELIEDLFKSRAIEAMWVKELLEIRAEEARHALLTTGPEDFMRKQGEAQALTKLHAALITEPVKIPGANNG